MEQPIEQTVDVNVDSNVEVQPEVTPEVKPEPEVKVEPPVETKKEIMIPKERFDEVNNNFKQLKAELEELKKAQQSAKEEPQPEAKEEPKVEVPNPELVKLQQQVESFNAILDGMVQDKLKAIPEELHELIPEGLSTEQKLAWINKAEEKGLFKKQVAQVEIGKPLNHSSEQNQAERIKKMNPLQALASYYSQGK